MYMIQMYAALFSTHAYGQKQKHNHYKNNIRYLLNFILFQNSRF